MSKIYFITGQVQSGKTTRLTNWVESKENVAGILCPVKEGKRYLYSIASDEYRKLEADSDSENKDLVNVGKFRFYRESFDWANKEILTAIKNKKEWIIIDEVGPLELKGEGLNPSLVSVIKNLTVSGSKLVLVVREKLVNEVIKQLNLNRKEIDFNLLNH